MRNIKKTLCIVALIAACVILLTACSESKKLMKEAEELFASEYYEEAAEIANTILAEHADSKEAEDAKRLLGKISDVYMDEAKDAYKDGDLEEAQEIAGMIVTDFADTEAAEDAKELCADIDAENIEALINAGDYIGAQEYLDAAEYLEDKEEWYDIIRNETMIMHAILQVKPVMKNPASLQIAQVEFYAPTGGYSETDPYPYIFIAHSGQNGFGGFSTSYSIFSTEDLERFGSTSKLDPDELDYDEYYERLIATLIENVRKRDEEKASYDLNRLNQHLSNNVTVTLDIERYKKTTSDEEQEI